MLNFLGSEDALTIGGRGEDDDATKDFEISRMKLSKQFKLIEPIPKLQSVPANPQFFDMAGGFLNYISAEDAEVEAKKYEIQGGMFSAITGFFSKK